MRECDEIELLFKQLENSEKFSFPETGKIKISGEKGVYIIYNSTKSVLHVGGTPSGRNGINQRLYNHLSGSSSFSKNYLKALGISLRNGHFFRFIEVEDPRKRALLESLAIGKLCPAHLGTGERKIL